MEDSPIYRKYRELFLSMGEQALNALYPREFEVYMMSLELTTSDGKLIDYLSFPIMPNSYSQIEGVRVNVKKTLNGVSILSSKSFTPKQVSLSGTFGRNFKFLNSPASPFLGLSFSTKSGVYTSLDTNPRTPKLNLPTFAPSIKTGYGVTKLLQAIIAKSTSLDSKGKPFKLFFHNSMMGESHLAVPAPNNALTISQNLETNRIHGYSLNLVLVMPVDYLANKLSATSLGQKLSSDAIQKGVNSLSNTLKRSL